MRRGSLAIALAMLVASCADPEVADTTLAETTTSTSTTTSLPPPPPPEPETTTTIEATTTTVADAETAYWAILAEERTYLIEAMEAFYDFDIESVDKVEFDAEGRTIIISVSSIWSGRDARLDLAWDLTRTFVLTFYSATGDEGRIASQVAGLWESWGGPAIHLTVDSVRVECEPEILRAMADRAADRADWEQACL